MGVYGLVGKNIAYSFSKAFFTEKFETEKRNDSYENFDIPSLEKLPEIIKKTDRLRGLNVTIPYKEAIIPYLDDIEEEAKTIGAVNTIKVHKNGKLTGYNTDHYGFAKSLEVFFPFEEKTALVLGSGGASKAIRFVLDVMGFEYKMVSRNEKEGYTTYQDLNEKVISEHKLIINCTPLGTHPKVEQCPPIPYQFITKQHMLFDLIYNPATTEFLKRGFAQGAQISNGHKMLEEQALKAWAIWKS